MIDLDARLRWQLDALVPLPPARDASWEEALRRAEGEQALVRGPGGRRRVALATVAVAAVLVAVAVSPVGAELVTRVSDFSAWLSGHPGQPAPEAEQEAFTRENERSWAGFPEGTKLRLLTRDEVAGGTLELYGFRSGRSLCLRLRARGLDDSAATSCAPLSELRTASAPALVVLVDYSFGRQELRPTENGLVPPRVQASAGIVADGVEAVELRSQRGWQRATVDANAFLAVVEDPPLGLRMREARAMLSDGERIPIPLAAPFGTFGVAPAGERSPRGPARVERHVEGGTIGWVLREEPRGEPLSQVASGGRGVILEYEAGRFARVVRPDPASRYRVALALVDRSPEATRRDGFGPDLCAYLITRSGSGGGCSPLDRVFARLPMTVGIYVASGGDQYAVVDGVASDDVARIELFLATGERVAVPLRDNAFVVQAARVKFPARLVAYGGGDRVIGIQTLIHDPLGR